MKLLRITAEGLPLFKEKLDLTFYAQQRIAEEQKSILYPLFSNIYLNSATGFIGINALCKGLLGYAAGISKRNLYKNNFFVPIAAVLAATFLNAMLYYLFSVLIGSNVGLEKLMLSSIPDAVYNMCFSPVFYAIFYNFFVMKSND